MDNSPSDAVDFIIKALNKMIKSGSTNLPKECKERNDYTMEPSEEEEVVEHLLRELEKPSSRRRICVLVLMNHYVLLSNGFRSAIQKNVQILKKFVRQDRKMFPAPPRNSETPFMKNYAKNMAKQMMEVWNEKFGMDLNQTPPSKKDRTIAVEKKEIVEEIAPVEAKKKEYFLSEYQRKENQRNFIHDFFVKLHDEKFGYILETIDRAYYAMDNYREICGSPEYGNTPSSLEETDENTEVIQALRNERNILAHNEGIFRTFFMKLHRYDCNEESVDRLRHSHARICSVLRLVDLWLPKNLRTPEEPMVPQFEMDDEEPEPLCQDKKGRKRFSFQKPVFEPELKRTRGVNN